MTENRDASVTLTWADGDYTFRLAWGQLIELQEKLDAGPAFILDKFYNGGWKVEYISEVIRLGLIGGGLSPTEALKLTRNYVESRPPFENLSTAQGILAISLIGAPEEKLGEGEAARTKNESMIYQTGKSEFQPSMAPEPQQDIHHSK